MSHLPDCFTLPKKGRAGFYKAIKSAIDNAKYALKVSDDLLEFKLFTVEQGNALKRFRPGGRGTAKPYKKKYSHIKIVLTVKQAKKACQRSYIIAFHEEGFGQKSNGTKS